MGDARSLSKTACPIPCDGQCLVTVDDLGESSEVAPAASMNGFPVIAIAAMLVRLARHPGLGSARRDHARPRYSVEWDHARCPA
jgi:hypothetical protein